MDKLHILKIGGKVLEQPAQGDPILEFFTNITGPKVLVHGGGKRADQLCRQLNIEPQMREGRRITDEATLEIVTMVYAGLLNKQLVAKLQSMGANAIGLSGADGNVIQAHKRPAKPFDWGYAGDVDQVNTEVILALIKDGLVPVFCAITHDQNGQLLNTNADTIAAEVAIALAPHFEVHLHYCFEKGGVLANPDDDEAIIPSLNTSNYRAYVESGVISAGMKPKLDNAFRALEHQVQAVRIGNFETIPYGRGTKLELG